MPDTPGSLAGRLRQEGDRVIDFFNHLSQEQWERHIYPDEGNWRLHDLLAHMVSAEIARRLLIISVARGGNGAPIGFDIDVFNQSEVDRLADESGTHLLGLFSQERTKLIEFVSGLSMDDLQKLGNDPYLGKVNLLEMIRLTYLHLNIHLRDARRCL